MAKEREPETLAETAQRQEVNRACMAKKRASESVVETVQRQDQSHACTKKKKKKKRALVVSIEK